MPYRLLDIRNAQNLPVLSLLVLANPILHSAEHLGELLFIVLVLRNSARLFCASDIEYLELMEWPGVRPKSSDRHLQLLEHIKYARHAGATDQFCKLFVLAQGPGHGVNICDRARSSEPRASRPSGNTVHACPLIFGLMTFRARNQKQKQLST